MGTETLPPELVLAGVIIVASHAFMFFLGWGSGRITLLPLKSQVKTWKDRAERAEEQAEELHAVLNLEVKEALDG